MLLLIVQLYPAVGARRRVTAVIGHSSGVIRLAAMVEARAVEAEAVEAEAAAAAAALVENPVPHRAYLVETQLRCVSQSVACTSMQHLLTAAASQSSFACSAALDV